MPRQHGYVSESLREELPAFCTAKPSRVLLKRTGYGREKRGLREMRVLENLKNMIRETNEHTVPECRDAMESSLKDVLQRLQAANDSVRRLQEKEQERRKMYNDHLVASEKQHQLQWEELMREEPHRRAAVDEEHRRAVERLREQYAEMEKDLSKFATF
ncbi:PREDICTED: biogenesis of lysosome-related organelles complex 1 subunit 5 isoform X2 [Chinchilla lanigera]|uniref:biogenesis of lysosome-related organelles complex 1 subunit 5 isoform X2 n=1 Tax=Chinchilla lanigera TaxID=34839 RepID=UPI00038F0DD2|nr:PREDICTED: biogenesis of lysosome-related organelles complex 1 subunit 5 isoform X2 [Chinchilla lanigera]